MIWILLYGCFGLLLIAVPLYVISSSRHNPSIKNRMSLNTQRPKKKRKHQR